MNRNEIKELLNQKYDRTKFKQLTQSIFSKCDYFNSPKSIDANNDKVLDFLQLGNINLLDGKNLAIFELKLRKYKISIGFCISISFILLVIIQECFNIDLLNFRI